MFHSLFCFPTADDKLWLPVSCHGNSDSAQEQVIAGKKIVAKNKLEYSVECRSKADSPQELVLTGNISVCGRYQSL